ncbi:hypothetical protein [Flavobacterium commune]|uniref:Uncharacterized protein n=1 Tax=Flavobacterium commune TaxID=1306519 RepID=A0A1D9PCA9_9FLAO|nr:hypothetical protein [Flavobacterium commune]APA00210.1 hypothetical protein BIW12_12660 [Flavobacterium commune]
MEQIKLTRQQLYDLVWENPLSKLAKKYNLSDNGLRKVCKKLDIPLPKNGHWQKIKFNKKVIIEKLPVNNKVENSITLNFRENAETVIKGEGNELHQLTTEIKNTLKSSIIFPEKLTKPHPLIIEAKNDLKTKEPSYIHNIRGLLNTSVGVLNITVSPQNIKRALLFMDIFIKAIQKRGHKIIVKEGSKIVIDNIELGFGLRERLKRKIVKGTYYDSTELYPSNILSLSLYVYPAKEWTDTNTSKLEDKIPNIIAKLELQAVKEKQDEIQREIWHQENERRLKIEQEFKARKAKEIIKTQKLFSDAEKFEKATIYRNFINATEQKAIQENTLTEELKEWIKWANEKADWFDPFINREDELLNDNDREEFHKPKQTNYYYR